jgi:hypothetical protein
MTDESSTEYELTIRIDEETQALLDSIMERTHENVSPDQLFMTGLSVLHALIFDVGIPGVYLKEFLTMCCMMTGRLDFIAAGRLMTQINDESPFAVDSLYDSNQVVFEQEESESGEDDE